MQSSVLMQFDQKQHGDWGASGKLLTEFSSVN